MGTRASKVFHLGRPCFGLAGVFALALLALVQSDRPALAQAAGSGLSRDAVTNRLIEFPYRWRIPATTEWWVRTVRIVAPGSIGFPRRVSYLRDGYYANIGPGNGPCGPGNNTPVGAVKRLLVSFATQDTAILARLLTTDYRFNSADSDFRARFPTGLDRAAQIDSVARLPATPDDTDPYSLAHRTLQLLAEFPDTLA